MTGHDPTDAELERDIYAGLTEERWEDAGVEVDLEQGDGP